MAFTSSGLPNNGKTAHYQISYDTTLSPVDGVARALDLFNICEADFALMSGWFAGVNLIFNFPLPVQIVNAFGGASWSNPSGFQLIFGSSPTITIKPASGTSVNVIRYLLVSEVTEMFMVSKNNQWAEPTSLFQGGDEGSMGEGLSRFLGVQFQLANGIGGVPPPGAGVVPVWLNGARPDFVNNDPDDNRPDIVTGCTTLFIYYLFNQLNFSIQQIINAGASNLAGVYQNLTGQPAGWASFIDLVNRYYPPAFSPYTPKGDNIFPVSDLNAFFPPNPITCGYGQTTLISIDRPAMAQVNVVLTSDNPGLVQVPGTVTIPVGGTSAPVTISTTAIPIPFAPQIVNLHASYAGKTITVACEVVPPYLTGLTIAPAKVTCGDNATGTITLSQPSLSGPVVATMLNGSTFANVPATVTIPPGVASQSFVITTPNIPIPFKTAICSIYATYGSSSASAVLLVASRVIAPIMSSLTVFPTTVTIGEISRGTVTLVEAVPMPAVIALEAMDPTVGPGGPLPLPGSASSIASVPASITIPPGQTVGIFNITTHGIVSPGTHHFVRIVAGGIPLMYAALTVNA
ncbi:hypothetical protein [Tunturiibacter gelidiferens]|uniref:Uncharacterized protein n=1 Tax=Tunturiibacter gelidiferens TaxID=3069689 RepID=A0AAU7Z3A5_9BACT